MDEAFSGPLRASRALPSRTLSLGPASNLMAIGWWTVSPWSQDGQPAHRGRREEVVVGRLDPPGSRPGVATVTPRPLIIISLKLHLPGCKLKLITVPAPRDWL